MERDQSKQRHLRVIVSYRIRSESEFNHQPCTPSFPLLPWIFLELVDLRQHQVPEYAFDVDRTVPPCMVSRHHIPASFELQVYIRQRWLLTHHDKWVGWFFLEVYQIRGPLLDFQLRPLQDNLREPWFRHHGLSNSKVYQVVRCS